jgi:hypothetical protein
VARRASAIASLRVARPRDAAQDRVEHGREDEPAHEHEQGQRPQEGAGPGRALELEQPLAAAHRQVVLVPRPPPVRGELLVRAGAAVRGVEERVLRRGVRRADGTAIVEADAKPLRRRLGHHARHEVFDAQHHVHEADEVLPALRDGAGARHRVHRQVHDQPVARAALLHEAVLAREHGRAGVARLLGGLAGAAPHEDVQAEGVLVALHGLHVVDHPVLGPLARGPDVELRVAPLLEGAIGAHQGHERLAIGLAHAPQELHRLHARQALSHLQPGDVGVEREAGEVGLVVGERIEPVEQVDIALDAALHHAGGHPRLAGEFGPRLALGLPPHHVPARHRGRDAQPEDHECNALLPEGIDHLGRGGLTS